MSVYNEANNASDANVSGGSAPFNYLDGDSKHPTVTNPGAPSTEGQAGADKPDAVTSRSAGDAPCNGGDGIASAPTVTEMYRGPERGFHLARDVRGPHRALNRGQDRLHENHENKRPVQSEPELGYRQGGGERTTGQILDDNGIEGIPSGGRVMEIASASDLNASVSLDQRSDPTTRGHSEVGVAVDHAPSVQERSNVLRVTSNSSVHKLSRRSERRLKKNHRREDAEEEEMASILNLIYRQNAHNDSNSRMMALKSTQKPSQIAKWHQERRECVQRGADYQKVTPPKNNVNVNSNNNNDAISGSSGERVSCNHVMEALRQQPMKFVEKERFRSAALSLAAAAQSSAVGNFDRKRHLGFRRRQLNERRRREARGSGGFFVRLIKEFGQPITSYFDFLRWMILVNCVLSILVLVFLVVPQYLRENNNSNDNNNKAVVVPLPMSPLECPYGPYSGVGGEGKTANESSHWTEKARSVVPALLSGSSFMTRYPSPIFFSFYGANDGRNASRSSSVRLTSSLHFPYDFPLAYVMTLHVCVYIFIVFVLVKMAPFALEAISAKLERVDRGFAFMIFATFDHGATDETTLIMNQITMTDELLSKLDAAEASSVEGRRRVRARRCCDVIVRLVVASLLLGLVFLVAWTLRITLLEKPFFVAFLPGVVGVSRPDWPSISAAARCAAAFFDDFLAPCVLFFGLKVFKSFSTMMVSVENWKPAKKGKINEGRVMVVAILLTFYYMHCLWKTTVDLCERKSSSKCVADWFIRKTPFECPLEMLSEERTAGCSQHANCWPLLIGQHFYRLWLLDFLWSVSVVVLIQFPRKILFSRLCLHRSCGRFSIQPFSISRRIFDLIYAQMVCLLGLYYAPGLVVLNAAKFIFIFYLMRLTVHCNCIPKGRLFQSINAIVFSYTLLCVAALASLLPFQLVLMQGLPIQECGPFTGVQSFSQIFHLAAVLPTCIVVPATTLLDSPLAPFLIFMVAVIVVAGVAIAVTFLVQRQKLYQLQHENDAERRDRTFLLQRYDAVATAAPSSSSLKNAD